METKLNDQSAAGMMVAGQATQSASASARLTDGHSVKLSAIVCDRRRRIAQAAADAKAVPATFYQAGPAAALLASPRVIVVGLTDQQAVTELQAIVTACQAAGHVVGEAEIRLAMVHIGSVQGIDADEAAAEAIANAAKEIQANWLVIGPKVRCGRKAQETISDLGHRTGLVTVHPGVADIVAQVLHLSRAFAGMDLAAIGAAFNGGRFGTKVRATITDTTVAVIDNYGRALFTLSHADDAWAINGRIVKPNVAVMIEAAPFAPGGNTLVALLNPTSFIGLALGMLALACQDGGRAKDIVYGWLMGLEMALVPIAREAIKQDADTQVFNRDQVLGAYTVFKTARGSLRGKAACMTAGVGAHLRHTVPGAEFLPSAKGDWFLTFSEDYLATGNGLAFRTAEGQLGLHAKGTKHLDGFFANVAGSKTITAVVMAGTPFSQGGAMPVCESILDDFTAVESKTLLQADRSWSSIRAMHEDIRSGRWELRVKTGEQVIPGAVLAVVNGKEVRWSNRQAKGSAGAVVIEATMVEATVMGEPALRLVVRADVVFTGTAKGRRFGKVMAVGLNASATEVFEVVGDRLAPMHCALISDGAVKVSASASGMIRKDRETVCVVRRRCNEQVFDLLVKLYGKGGSAEDDRYTFDRDTLTVSIKDNVWVAAIDVGVESSPVHEAVGSTSLMLTQAAFIAAADRYTEGAGSAVLRSMYGDRITERAKLVRYAKANASASLGRLPLADGTIIPVVGWVERNPDGNLAGPQRQFADVSGSPKVAEHFSVEDTDVEVLQKMAGYFPWVIVRAANSAGETHAVSIHSASILALAGRQSPGGKLGGVGHVAAELLRCVLFPTKAKAFRGEDERVGLIRKFRRELHKLAYGSPALNRIYKVQIGVAAKAVPDWCTPDNVVRLNPYGEPAARLAKLFSCRVRELTGKRVLVARHPVTAVYVASLELDDVLSRPVVLVNELTWRTKLLADTDGDQACLFPVHDAELADRLAAGLERMLPAGDINQAVTGVPATDPAHKLFAEIPKRQSVEQMLTKTSIKAGAEWHRQLDEQAHTALAICGSSYKLGEFASYLAGLGLVDTRSALVGGFLYENRGLAGEAASDACKSHLTAWNRGLRRRHLSDYAADLAEDLGHGLPKRVQIPEAVIEGLAVASEFKCIAAAGAIPVNELGEETIDRIGGAWLPYETAWPLVALLQSMGRGHVAKADNFIARMDGRLLNDAEESGVGGGFLFDLCRIVAGVIGPVVAALAEEGELGRLDGDDSEGARFGHLDDWADELDLDLPDWVDDAPDLHLVDA